jgi:hypothetical protein
MPDIDEDASTISAEDIEKVHRFLTTVAGKKLVRASRQLMDSKRDLQAAVHELKTQLRSESDDLGNVYEAVGEFVVRFSQLEFFIRMEFDVVSGLEPEQTLPIVSQLDFRSLVAVTTDLCRREFGDKPNWRQIESIFKRCNDINDSRVRIVHGSWILASLSEFGTLYLSRQSRKWQPQFDSLDAIRREIDKLERVESDLLALLAGEYDPDPLGDE